MCICLILGTFSVMLKIANICLNCSIGLPVFPTSCAKYCLDCYFAQNYCKQCMCYNTACMKEGMFNYVCRKCGQNRKCTRNIWNKKCNIKPRFPLLYPAVCYKHFTKNISKNLVDEFSKMFACCRCGNVSSSVCFEVYCTLKYSNLRVCRECACALTLANVSKCIPVYTLAEFIVTFLFSGYC